MPENLIHLPAALAGEFPGLSRSHARRLTETGEAQQVVLLLPCATDTAWFHELVWPHAELFFIRGRVRFIGWRGTPLPSPRAPSLVAVFRHTLRGRSG